MNDDRPTPEQMLARLKAEAQRDGTAAPRGRLRLFFGYAAGIGKTYAMLQSAQAAKKEGKDIVVGYVEPHGRPETEALLAGLECLPTLTVTYRGATLHDFDLDAALSRRPEIILVDELAHTNAPGLRHAKRWQDVEELLAARIDVYSTVNVQHVESLNDIVAEISGVVVRETVPDEVFERADDVTLIDLPPDELLERLRQGKVYIPEQAAYALEKFFRKDNLVALREIALRRTADRIHEDVETARRGVAAKIPWPTNERLLVCVGPSPTSAKVVRAAKRLADRLDAPWVAVHVQTARAARMNEADRQRLHHHLRLAESLGAEIAQISGADVVDELIQYAADRNVTKIVVGKADEPPHRWFPRRLSLVERLVRDSGCIDVFVVRGLGEPVAQYVAAAEDRTAADIRPWLGTAVALALATLICLIIDAFGFTEANLVMVYLLAVVAVAARYGALPSVAASVLSVLLFDVLFTEPYYWFTVHDTQYLLTFAVMLAVGLLASTLTARVRYQADVARRNERRTEALYRLSRRLTAAQKTSQLIEEAEKTISEVFDAYAVIFLPDDQARIRPVVGHLATFAASATEFAAAQWVLDHDEPAGRGTNTLPNAEAVYLPMATPNGVVGVLAVQAKNSIEALSLDARQLLDTYATQIALAVERNRLSDESQQARIQIETEKLRSSLLSAVSHDLRTPLAAIAGSASSLSETFDSFDAAMRHELLETIRQESERLTRLVENLLHMTRLSSGRVTLNRQWLPLDEVIGSALHRMERMLAGREVCVELADGLPLACLDDVLIESVLVNLLDNAVKYSDAGSPLRIRGEEIPGGIAVEVADRGRGLAPGDEQRIFEMFYRGADAKPDRRGTGLGLAICKAIVKAHGGTIEARNRPERGASIRFVIPHEGSPPSLDFITAEQTHP
jgi:two-component system, OmpR family, sensor histidine kinase KdpD